MFITVGKPVPPGDRPSIDLSRYRSLTAEMRWVSGSGSCVGLGVKDRIQPDDGTETTVQRCFTNTEWSTVSVPLAAFKNADLTHLYVVFEVVLSNLQMTMQLRNVRYSPKEAPSPSPEPTVAPIPHPVSPTPPPPRVVPPPEPTVAPAPSTVRNIYVGSLMDGLDIGIDTSGHRFGWLTADHGTLTLQYPDQQTWGAMFVTVGTPVPAGNRPSIDLSQYRYLSVEMRWVSGAGKCVGLGIKDRTQPDDGTETKVQRCLTSEWTTVTVPLSDFTNADLTHLYVVFEVVFATVPMTVQLRNVRYSTT